MLVAVSLKKMSVGLLSVILFCGGFAANAATAPTTIVPAIQSFKEWRNAKLTEVRARYNKLETEYISKKSANPKDKVLKSIYGDLKNTKSHLDEINDLTVSDYFVGYLSRFKDQKSTFQAVAAKLDSAEVAELMTAYADSLLKTSGEGISTSQPGPTTEASK